MAKKSQAKGKRGEIELMGILHDAGYPDVQRGGYCFGEKPDLYGLPHIHIEAKRTEALRLYDAMTQAKMDAVKFGDGEPTVFSKRNRGEWLVTMPLTSWLKLYKGEISGFKGSGAQ